MKKETKYSARLIERNGLTIYKDNVNKSKRCPKGGEDIPIIGKI